MSHNFQYLCLLQDGRDIMSVSYSTGSEESAAVYLLHINFKFYSTSTCLALDNFDCTSTSLSSTERLRACSKYFTIKWQIHVASVLIKCDAKNFHS